MQHLLVVFDERAVVCERVLRERREVLGVLIRPQILQHLLEAAQQELERLAHANVGAAGDAPTHPMHKTHRHRGNVPTTNLMMPLITMSSPFTGVKSRARFDVGQSLLSMYEPPLASFSYLEHMPDLEPTGTNGNALRKSARTSRMRPLVVSTKKRHTMFCTHAYVQSPQPGGR